MGKFKALINENVSAEQLKRVEADWSRIAKEKIKIDDKYTLGDDIMAFGSELACLRIAYYYKHTDPKKYKVQYSTNLKTWYFVLYKHSI